MSLISCAEKIERLHYPCSENKGADQLRGFRPYSILSVRIGILSTNSTFDRNLI